MNEEIILYWAGATLYGLGGALAIIGLVFRKERLLSIALVLSAIGLLPHGSSIIIRWARVGHGPYINMYEVMSSDAWIAMLFYLLVQWRFRFFRNVSIVILPVIFLAMGFGLMSSAKDIFLPPSLRSYWLVLHVVFAKLCSASFLAGFGSSALYLYRDMGRADTAFGKGLPSLERLDFLVYKFNVLGSAFLTIMIVAGAIWANNAWGRYWAFDPIETWSLIVWLCYGLFLHLRLSREWKGRKSALLTLFIFLFSILAFFFIPYFLKTAHSEYLVR